MDGTETAGWHETGLSFQNNIINKTLKKAQQTQDNEYSTPLVQSRSFNKHGNLGKASAWFCMAKGEEFIEKL